MSQTANGQFNYRAFVSVLAGFTFAAMAVTGLVMFFAPSCRIARDTSWTVWGYGKDQWTAVHVWFSIAFVIASAFHIYLNWVTLTNYFKTRLHQGFAFRTEWIAAVVICGVIGLGTLYEVAPFSLLTAWKETFKRAEGGSGAGGQGGSRERRGVATQGPVAARGRTLNAVVKKETVSYAPIPTPQNLASAKTYSTAIWQRRKLKNGTG